MFILFLSDEFLDSEKWLHECFKLAQGKRESQRYFSTKRTIKLSMKITSEQWYQKWWLLNNQNHTRTYIICQFYLHFPPSIEKMADLKSPPPPIPPPAKTIQFIPQNISFLASEKVTLSPKKTLIFYKFLTHNFCIDDFGFSSRFFFKRLAETE